MQCVITGANTGIGKITATALAKAGHSVVLASRSRDKTLPVIEEIKQANGNDRVQFVALDLGDLDSVRRAADEILALGPINVLINNAGLVARGQTKQGFELTFGTNHLGHYLLTRLLLDRIKASTPARIVNVSSHSHYRAKGIDWDAQTKTTRSISGLPEYEVSKLANVLFTTELARRLDGTGVTTYAVHPGVVATDVWRRIPWPFRSLAKLFMLSPEKGAESTIVAATSPELASDTGRYYTVGGKEKRPSRVAQDEALARALWDRSAAWVGLTP